MESQLLVAQLAVLFEQGAPQQASAGKPCRPVSLTPCRRRSCATRLTSSRCRSSHCDTDLVFGEKIEYVGLDGAFLAHCRLRRWRVWF